MAKYINAEIAHIKMGRLKHGDDLLEALTEICAENNVNLGQVQAIGAVRKARIGFYDQEKRVYEFLEFDKPLEILSMTGNISLKDEKPIIHAHITLSGHDGKAFGGHLAPGTEVFACEFIIKEFSGIDLERKLDNQTGLPLWHGDEWAE